MLRTSPAPTLVPFTALTLLAACGAEPTTVDVVDSSPAPAPPAALQREVQGDWRRLVPEDAVAVVSFESLSGAESKLKQLVGTFDEREAASVDLLALLREDEAVGSLGRWELVDHDAPFALVLSLPADLGQPVPTFLLPTTDAFGFAESLAADPTTAEPLVLGDYVGVSLGAEYELPEEVPALTADLPETGVALRVDLATLIDRFRPFLDAALENNRSIFAHDAEASFDGGGALVDQGFAAAASFLESAETFEVTADLGEFGFDLAASFTAREGSPLADVDWAGEGDMQSLLPYLELTEPVLVLFTADMETLFDSMLPLMSSFEGTTPAGGGFGDLLAQAGELYEHYGDAAGAVVGFGSEGLHYSYVFQTPDAAAFASSHDEFFKSGAMESTGLALDHASALRVGEVPVAEYSLELTEDALDEMPGGLPSGSPEYLQAKKMLDSMMADQLRFSFGTHEDRVAMVQGGGDDWLKSSMRRLRDGGAVVPRALESALEHVGDARPAFVLHMDVGEVFADMQLMMLAAMGAPADASALPKELRNLSAPVTVFGGLEDRTWTVGASLDLERMKRFVEAMEDM
jgi:hypothetical protein